MSRFNTRTKAINNSEQWEKTLEDRGVKQIEQYMTPSFKQVTEEEMLRIKTFDYTWRNGDKFWRIAAKNLGDQRLWWVIARLNNKPTEALLKEGEIIKIPVNVAVALEVLL